MDSKIWLSSPHMGGDEIKFVNEAFASNWIAPLGPNVDGFEEDLQKYTGVRHAAALSSGTSAIHLALILLGVLPGDEVLCQSFTFSASANPIKYVGANPVFIDSEPDTWNMSPKYLEIAIKDRLQMGKKVKAIIPVHLYGMPAKMKQIIAIAQKFGIPVIEDAAEALGSTYHGKHAGSFGNFGVLSFNGNKIITTSGGGALLSDNEELIGRARFLATQAREHAPHYQHSEIGFNYRMSNIAAGIGRGQMTVLDKWVKARRENFDFYKSELSHIEFIRFLEEPEHFYSNRWLTTIMIDPVKGIDRETLRMELGKHNIESRPLWKPMHLQPVFEQYPFYGSGLAQSLFEIGLCLPSGSNLSPGEIGRVVDIIISLYKGCKLR